jgi:hypothetical protein
MPDAKAVGLASFKPAKFVLNKFLLKGVSPLLMSVAPSGK